MIFILAEKPSLGRAIAQELPGKEFKGDNCINKGEYRVGWISGHVLELAKPEEYKEEYKTWDISHLPIVPEDWKLNPIARAKGLISSVRKHLKEADYVINAGDPDREGQLLIDEILNYLGWKGDTKRLKINDPTPKGVQEGLKNIESNSNFINLYQSGLARQRADWIYGLNMTRLYTILGQENGYNGVLSVGRVQTPVLGLIVKRQDEIDNFKSIDHYLPFAMIKGCKFNLKINDAILPYFDKNKRLIHKSVASQIQDALKGDALVQSVEQKEKKENPPLLFSLSDLQIYANRNLDFSALETLNLCQSLYETHKLVTYPRSDCSYLPDAHFEQADELIKQIKFNLGSYESWNCNSSIKSKSFNDKKITAHHAIVPTLLSYDLRKLKEKELKLYIAICERYLLQYFEPYRYLSTTVIIKKGKIELEAKGKQVIDHSWKKLIKSTGEKDTILPEFQQDEQVTIDEVGLDSKKTTPPPLFNPASLLEAMGNIAKYVDNVKLKKILKETDGIGTEATKANIIETLFKRDYIQKKSKSIIPTETGKALIRALPGVAKNPDMTAYWELSMKDIENGRMSLKTFMKLILDQLPGLIDHAKNSEKIDIKASGINALTCPKCRKEKMKSNKLTYFCSDYENCGFKIWKKVAGKQLTESQAELLITKKRTKKIDGFKSSKEGAKKFSAYLVLKSNFEIKFEFDKSSGTGKKKFRKKTKGVK